ncbi:MAG: hypothetical protein ACE5HS_08045 [bacterium]
MKIALRNLTRNRSYSNPHFGAGVVIAVLNAGMGLIVLVSLNIAQ